MAEIYRPEVGIEGVIIRPLERHRDERGWLVELFRSDWPEGRHRPVMGYISLTEPGAGRGPHEHREQTDYFCFIGPSRFRVYFWDNRPGSPTSGQSARIETDEDSPLAVIVPPGVVHAYKNIGATAGYVFNAPDKLYRGPGRGSAADEIRYEEGGEGRFVLD